MTPARCATPSRAAPIPLPPWAYEAARLPATARVVLANRATPPDAILREVWLRTGDRPFTRIEDVIDVSELRGISERYKEVAGFESRTAEPPNPGDSRSPCSPLPPAYGA